MFNAQMTKFVGLICFSLTVSCSFSFESWSQSQESLKSENFVKKSNTRSRSELDKIHTELIRQNELLSRKRKVETSSKMPSGVEIVDVETVKFLLDLGDDKKSTDTLNKNSKSISISKNFCIQKNFAQVSWLLCVTDTSKKSLWVGPVFMKRTPTDGWHKVVALAGLADIFVPYHNIDFRPYDLRWITKLNQVGSAEAGANGSIVTLNSETAPTVVIENRDIGIGLLCHQNPNIVKRSEEFLVWGVADGGNYDNIIQYGFRDDGVMTFRLGATGYGSPDSQREVHTHNGLWRVDIDVNGSASDTAYLQKHSETVGSTGDQSAQVSYESGHSLIAQEYTSIVVSDSTVNANGNKLSFEFVPFYTGLSRHFEPGEMWTQKDIHFTRYKPLELGWLADIGTSVQTIFELVAGTGWLPPDQYVLSQGNPPEFIANSDVVVWLKTSFHHVPTDEENPVVQPPNSQGVTSAHWSGFDLMPRNFFNANPLSPNLTCNH
jgi:Copper amine oxidase, enzyme domain